MGEGKLMYSCLLEHWSGKGYWMGGGWSKCFTGACEMVSGLKSDGNCNALNSHECNDV